MHDCGVRGTAIVRRSGVVRGRVPTRIGGTSASRISMSAVIVTASRALETMTSPTVVVSPVFPRSNSQEDAIVKISGSVITGGGTGVGRIAIVAIRTERRHTYIDCHLCIRPWNQGQGTSNAAANIRNLSPRIRCLSRTMLHFGESRLGSMSSTGALISGPAYSGSMNQIPEIVVPASHPWHTTICSILLIPLRRSSGLG